MTSPRPEPLKGLRTLLQLTRRISGRTFLEQITTGLSQLLQGAYVQVGRLSGDGLRIIADPCAQDGLLLAPLEYDLADTPCAHVVGTGTRYFESGVAEAYAEDRFLADNRFVSYLGCPMFSSTGAPSGLLSVLSTVPLSFGETEIVLFETLALRAGADMERGEAVAARALSEAQFREIVDQQTEMVCRFSPAGKVTFANRAYLETFGVTLEELGDFDYEPRLHPEDRAHVHASLARISAENPREVIENRIFAADGRTLWTQWTNIGLFDQAGNLVTYQSAGRDVTAAKTAEERLRQAHEQKDRFLAVLAHELRNPLGAVMNALSVLELQAAGGKTDSRALEIAKRQGQQQARLLDDLLDLSRITCGKVELRKTRLALFRLVSEVAESRRPAFTAKRQRLEVLVPDEDVFVEADRVRIEQIISNLLDNAGKYTGEGGRVQIAGEVAGEQALIRVVDDGQGISEDMLPRVFEMFEQDPRAGGSSGLGIGLTVVRDMVLRHGGSVQADSPGKGAGSTFTVCLPTLPAAAPLEPATVTRRAETAGRFVLVVDDNQDAADMLADLLCAWGHEAVAVYDGSRALEQARRRRPDVALIDIGMPVMDGYATARQLRAEHEGADMLLVALTGFGQPGDISRAHAACFDRHVTKPADQETLQSILCGRKV